MSRPAGETTTRIPQQRRNRRTPAALAAIIALLGSEQLTRTNPCPGNRTCPGDPADPPPCESCPCPVGPPGSGGGPAGSASQTGAGGAAANPCCNTNTCCGSAVWWVSEPAVALRIEDEPSAYSPGRGPRVTFHLSYRQTQSVAEDTNIFCVDTNWTCSFRAFVYGAPGLPGYSYLQKAGAAWVPYVGGNAQRRDGSISTSISTGYQI